jgi:hypothetical protein
MKYNVRGAACVQVAAVALLVSGAASANPFTISSPSTTAQTLGSNESGNVTTGGSLTVGGSTVAVTINGNNASLTNLGSIKQTGTGRVIRDNTGVTGLTITNGSATNSTALMQSADADVIQMNKSPASIVLNNYGVMTSLNASKGGAQVVDFNAILSGSNTINNYSTGIMQSVDADAVRPGVNGVVNNYGQIISTVTTDTGTDGVDAQQNSGVNIHNYSTGTISGARHGITGGAADALTPFTTTITNDAGGLIKGNNGSGVNLDGFNAKQTATVYNSGTILGNGVTGDGDGIDIDGLGTIVNTGIIRSLNAFSSTAPAQSEGITVGGGTITNSGVIEGLVAAGNANAVGRGITIAGNDITSGPLAGTREAIYGNTVITNQAGGLIRGDSDSGIAVEGPASGFTVTINNQAGATVRGGGSTSAIRTGADADTINNAGVIDGSSSGKAIDMGAGNNTLNITGGVASIYGDISGGAGGVNTMTIDPGTANTFAYAGAISNFNTVEVKSGTVTLSGVSSYTGATVVSGGTLILDGANRLSANSALQLNGGALKLSNAGGIDAQTFAQLALSADSTIDLAGSSLTFLSLGAVNGSAALTVLDFYAATNYAFRLKGDYSSNAEFLAFIARTTIDGIAATYRFDGTYTDVQPVPLPATLPLIGSGLGLLGFLRKRKSKGRDVVGDERHITT